MNNNADKGLQGNEKIEEAIAGLQKRNHTGNAGTYAYRDPPLYESGRSVHHCCGTAKGRWTDPTGGDQNRGRKKLVGGIYQL